MPVLYGVLMFMGVNTLRGMQFIDRLALMFMPTRYYLDVHTHCPPRHLTIDLILMIFHFFPTGTSLIMPTCAMFLSTRYQREEFVCFCQIAIPPFTCFAISGALVHWNPGGHPGRPLDHQVHLRLPHLPPHGRQNQPKPMIF